MTVELSSTLSSASSFTDLPVKNNNRGEVSINSAADEDAVVVIQGQIHNDESCHSLAAVTGTYIDTGAPITACVEGLDKVLYAGGATSAVLTDRSTNYLVGSIKTVTEMGSEGQIMTVEQIARMTE